MSGPNIIGTKNATVYCGNIGGRDVYVRVVKGQRVPTEFWERLVAGGFATTESLKSGKTTSEVKNHGKG